MKEWFLSDVFVVGLKEGCKLVLVWLAAHTYFCHYGPVRGMRAFYLGMIGAILAAFLLVLGLSGGWVSQILLGRILSTSFALFMLAAGVAMIRAGHAGAANDPDAGGDRRGPEKSAMVIMLLTGLGTMIFFAPDLSGSAWFVLGRADVTERVAGASVSALTGLVAGLLVLGGLAVRLRPGRFCAWLGAPQFLLLLAVVKLFSGGIRGVVELSLIPTVRRGLEQFFHQFLHQIFTLLMTPDHPFLSTTVWDSIVIFFKPETASLAALLILLAAPGVYLYRWLFGAMREPEAATPVDFRRKKAALLRERRRQALPVLAFELLILFGWLGQREDATPLTYDPPSQPVVAEGDYIIPRENPGVDLADGELHKFAYVHGDDRLRFMVITKSNDALSICLDACEMCPPSGYGRRGVNVVCIYCDTAIPIDTLGEPGGCNPIPVTSIITGDALKVPLREALDKWPSSEGGE